MCMGENREVMQFVFARLRWRCGKTLFGFTAAVGCVYYVCSQRQAFLLVTLVGNATFQIVWDH